MKKLNKIITFIVIFAFLVVTAILMYMHLLNISFLDALYMTIITISTVGYREVTEMTDEAKVFSVFFIIFSVGTIGILASTIIDYFSEGRVKLVWRRKKMEKAIDKLKNHYIICGAGETGQIIMKQFINRNVDFVVIEKDEEVLKEIQEYNALIIEDDATKEEALMRAKIENAKGLITTLSKDADNVYVTLTARTLNKKLLILARAHDETSHKKLRRAGANNTVSPNEIGGRKLANMMLKPSISHFMDHIIDTGNISIEMEEVIIRESSTLCNKTLKEANIKGQTGLIVLAIRTSDKDSDFDFNPSASTKLSADDRLIVVGEKDQIIKLKELAE